MTRFSLLTGGEALHPGLKRLPRQQLAAGGGSPHPHPYAPNPMLEAYRRLQWPLTSDATREELLTRIAEHVDDVVQAGGDDVVEGVVRAIHDVGRWWP